VPIAAGSPADVLGRLVAERMGTARGQSIIIENVPGADGTIGVGRVARARPDGPVAAGRSVLYAKASLPAKDLKELIAWLRANPNKASAGVTNGDGTISESKRTLVPRRSRKPAWLRHIVDYAGSGFFLKTGFRTTIGRSQTSCDGR
jgi:tripartite-type tricarboxylate transporter receptor subunit TctC